MTRCWQVAALPLLSVAVQVTKLVPVGNCAGALLVIVTVPQLSLAVGLPNATPVAKQAPAFTLTVTSAGQVIVGTWLSRTTTRCWQVAVLPLLSVAVQVTRLVPLGNCAGALLVIVTVPQLSLAVGLPRATPVAKQAPAFTLTVTSAGQVIVGTWLSRTTTRCWQAAVLPLLSVAVQVTRLVPVGNCAGALLVIVTVPQLSLAVGLPNATPVAKQAPELTLTVTSAGQVIVGTWLSRTTTRCWHVAVLPLLSVAVQVTRLVPVGNCAGALLVIVTVPQLSLAVGLPNATPVAKQAPELTLTVTSAGQVIVGTWLSRTTTRCWQLAVLPLLSVAVQVTRLVPVGNCAGALLVTVTVPQLSLAVGLPNATPVAKQAPSFTLTVTSAGQVIVGTWLSRTTTRCWQVAVLPLLSVAVQVTRLVPVGHWAGALLVIVTVPQLSLAVGLPNATPVAKQAPEFTLTVTSAGQVIVGTWLSRTTTRCWQVAVLPLLSVAVQVTRFVPVGHWAGALLVIVTVPQLSLAVGLPNATPVAKQAPEFTLTVTSAGQVIVGGWLSRTTTRCWQVAVLPLLSVAVQVTRFVPVGNCAGALLVMVTVPQLSLAVGLLNATPVAKQAPELTLTFTSAGQVIVGTWLSRTTTRCWQVAVLPLLSVAVQVTRLVPVGNCAGALLEIVTVPQLSLAIGLPRATPVAKQAPEFTLTVTSAGQVIVGTSLSRTTTRCWQVAVLPLLSVAVQVTRLVPVGNCAGALLVIVTVPQLSLAVGLPRATPVAKQAPEFTLTVTSAGQVIVGTWLSRTTTRCWQAAVLPLLSVAVQVTRLVPVGNCAGALLVIVTVPQLSLAVGLPRATPVAKQAPEFTLTVTSAGQVIVGTWLSRTTTRCWQAAVLPLLSVAVQVTRLVPVGNCAGALLVIV